VYSACVYPIIKEHEAGKEKRVYKVKPCGHIRYLVRYYASNIYRIWVPALSRVIITRNVTFDKDILYSREFKQAEG
jgi:hypothetical protein